MKWSTVFALLLPMLLNGVMMSTSAHAMSGWRDVGTHVLTVRQAVGLCNRTHSHLRTTVRGYLRGGTITSGPPGATVFDALFDSSKVPLDAVLGDRVKQYGGIRLVLTRAVVKKWGSISASKPHLTVQGVLDCSSKIASLTATRIAAATR